MTNSRCTICQALDEIASMIEKHEELRIRDLFGDRTLDKKQMNRIYDLATGKVTPLDRQNGG